MKEAETPVSPEYQAKYHSLKELLQGENRRVFQKGNEKLTISADRQISLFDSYTGERIKLHHTVTLEAGTIKAALACLYYLSPNGILLYGEIVTSNFLRIPHQNALDFDGAKNYDSIKEEEDRQFAQEEDQRRKQNFETLAFKIVEKFTSVNQDSSEPTSV